MFQLKTEDRLRFWREFRQSIDNISLPAALQQTSEFWTQAPFTPYYLDNTQPSTWPTPWQLVEENVYCDVAKSLGIAYTMLLTKHRKKLDIELRVYRHPDTGVEYNLSWFNQGKYILNLIDCQVVNITQFDKTLQLVGKYNASELQLENY